MTNCLQHLDRETIPQVCVAAARDRKNLAHNVCVCCDECRAECLTHPPHNHGGSIDDEWDRHAETVTSIRCKVCGIVIF